MYCIFDSEGNIIGRFKDYYRAVSYLVECENEGMNMEGIAMQKMTKEEFYEYMENLIKNT